VATLKFSEIPDALRYPGAYIEIDGSLAGLGGDLPQVLLVGQKLAGGTAPAGELIRVTGSEDAAAKAGAGSVLAQMYDAFRKGNTTYDVFFLPYADNPAGVAASGTITVTSAASVAGTIALYIAGRAISIAADPTFTATEQAQAIADAIAGANVPVIASVTDGTVTLTARHKGSVGNDIDVRLSLYGEDAPAGLALDIAALSGGAGDPAPGDLPALIGQKWFRYVALGMHDAATLAAWHAESQRRYKFPIQAGFRGFCAYRGDYEEAADFGETKNYEHLCCAWIGENPMTPWEAAAVIAAVASLRLYNNPVISLEGAPLPGLVAADLAVNDFTDGNSLLYKGISVLEAGQDGAVYIKRLITMYQRRSDGSADDAWLDINVPEVMERIRYEQRIGAIQRFRGTVAAKTSEGFAPGLPITTEDSVRAFLLSLYKNDLQWEKGWVQSYDYYKSTLIVRQNPDNPSRFDFGDDPVINSPYYILAGHSTFRRAVPTA
jgi:phage tail sheath gpL-like